MKNTTRNLIAFGLLAAVPMIVVACGSDDSSELENPGTAGTAGSGKGGSAGKGGTNQGGSSQGGTNQGGSAQGGSGQGGSAQGGSGQGGSAQGGANQGGANQGGSGQGGADAGPDVEEEAGPTWPTCDAKPSNVAEKTIPEIWTGNWADPEHVWVSGVYITGISKGGCVAGSTCQIFVQDAETYADFAAGAHRAIKLTAFSTVSDHFVGLAVGDKVDIDGYVSRSTAFPPQNELMFSVNKAYPACMKKVGSGTPTPISGVKLTDLTQNAYENTHGPLLVKVDGVSGKPNKANETFALWTTAGPFVEAGVDSIVSASPYFLPNGAFTGLPTGGITVQKFTSVAGVFGLFVPTSDGGTAKYLMLYPREMTDMVKAP